MQNFNVDGIPAVISSVSFDMLTRPLTTLCAISQLSPEIHLLLDRRLAPLAPPVQLLPHESLHQRYRSQDSRSLADHSGY